MTPLRPILAQSGCLWTVRVSTDHGVQEYRCGSEELARRWQSLFSTPIRARPSSRGGHH